MNRPATPRPLKRTNPSGKTAWVARYPCKDGKYRSAGTFARKGPDPQNPATPNAKDAIAAAMDREWSVTTSDTPASYLERWLRTRPRSDRTNRTNAGRIKALFDVELEGVAVRDWRYADLRPKHFIELVDHMLRVQGRAYTGTQSILRSWSAMSTDAVRDEVIEFNPVLGITVRANDPRILKPRKPIKVWSWEQMHTFATHGGAHAPLLRLVSDCFPRINEALAIKRDCVDFDTGRIHIRWTLDPATGKIMDGTKTTHQDGDRWEQGKGRYVPMPATLQEMLWEMPWIENDYELMFPTASGTAWRLPNFYKQVWRPSLCRWLASTGVEVKGTRKEKHAIVEAHGFGILPHAERHSALTHLAADGVDIADLAEMAGHSIETLQKYYRHAKRQSDARVKELIG